MFTEIAERPTHPRRPGFIPQPRSEATPCWDLAGLWELREETAVTTLVRFQYSRDLRRRVTVHRADLRRNKGGEGTRASLGGKPSQRKARVMLKVGFEGWIGVFQTSQRKKSSMCNGMVVAKEAMQLGTMSASVPGT